MAETQADIGQEQAGTGLGGQGLVPSQPTGLLPTGLLPPGLLPEAAQPEAAQPTPAGAPAPAPELPARTPVTADRPVTGAIHHVELWVPNLDRAIVSWGWLLTSLGYRMFQDWPGGRSWQAGHAYVVVEQSPARTASRHDRCRPGLNHLAFHVASRALVDELTAEALLHGWKLMFAELHPFAGGPQHYAAYLENADGFEAELVAD
jgi:catechol 2,3-dioxygenase-like lactoylglutathione lyase family enzyme